MNVAATGAVPVGDTSPPLLATIRTGGLPNTSLILWSNQLSKRETLEGTDIGDAPVWAEVACATVGHPPQSAKAKRTTIYPDHRMSRQSQDQPGSTLAVPNRGYFCAKALLDIAYAQNRDSPHYELAEVAEPLTN